MAHFKLIMLALVVRTATTGRTTLRTDVARVVGAHGQINEHNATPSDANQKTGIDQRELKKRIFLGGHGGGQGRYLWLFKGGAPQAFWLLEAGSLSEDEKVINFAGQPDWMPPLGEWDDSSYDVSEFADGAAIAIQRPGDELEVYPLPMWSFKDQFKMLDPDPALAKKLIPQATAEDLEKIVFAKKVLPNQAYLEEDLDLPGEGEPLSIDEPRQWGKGQQTKKDSRTHNEQEGYVYVFPERSKYGSEVYFSQVKKDGNPAIFARPDDIWFLSSNRRLPPGYEVCPEDKLKETAPGELDLFKEGAYMTVKYAPCSPGSMPYVWRALKGGKLAELIEIWREACGDTPYPLFASGF